MGLLLPYDPSGLEPKTAQAFDDLVTHLQVWASSIDGLGKWIDIPTSAPAWTNSSAGTWTVLPTSMQIRQYTVLQDLLLYRISLFHTTTSGMGNQLFVSLPDGWVCRDNRYIGVVEWDDDAGAGQFGIGVVLGTQDASNRRLTLVRDVLPTSTNWPNCAGTFNLRFNLQVPVVRQ